MQTYNLKIKPYVKDNTIEYADITVEVDNLTIKQDEKLFIFHKEIVKIPFAEYSNMSIKDDNGELSTDTIEDNQYPYVFLNWIAKRDVVGSIYINYRVFPREVPTGYRSSPYFDFRCEDGGCNTSGVCFLPKFSDQVYLFDLKWDFSMCPDSYRGVWTFGEGDQRKLLSGTTILNTYYAFGNIKSVADEKFGFYWLSEPLFDANELASKTKDLFIKMSEFFHDDGEDYRIFVRKDPFSYSGGGTALERSYLFGWSNDTVPTVDTKLNLLAHEMVHNWPQMLDEPYGISTWYNEGCAEFYSVVLLRRFGLYNNEQTLHEIQRRTDEYFTNPTRNLSTMDAAKICWEDRRAQKLAYARGMFFIANMDARIRRKTAGQHSIDEVVISLTEKHKMGSEITNADFITQVNTLLDEDITQELESMQAGERFTIDKDAFDANFTYEEYATKEADTNEDCISYQWTIR